MVEIIRREIGSGFHVFIGYVRVISAANGTPNIPETRTRSSTGCTGSTDSTSSFRSSGSINLLSSVGNELFQ